MTGCNPEACLECRQGRDCPAREAAADARLMRWLMAALTALMVGTSALFDYFR